MSTIDAAIIKHITEGSNGGSGGDTGNISDDKYVRYPEQRCYIVDNTNNGGGIIIGISDLPRSAIKNFNILKLKHKTGGAIATFLLYIPNPHSVTFPILNQELGHPLSSNDGTNKLYMNIVQLENSDLYELVLSTGASDTYTIDDSEECGLFEAEHLTYETLMEMMKFVQKNNL